MLLFLACDRFYANSGPFGKYGFVRTSFFSFFFFKERLDFSCAMFGPTGGLVANGPHVPMHLGSMQETVKYQVRCYSTSLVQLKWFPKLALMTETNFFCRLNN